MPRIKKNAEPTIGHNTGIAADKLKSLVNRVERLNKDRQDTTDDIREVYGEAKALGYDAKTIRQIVRERSMDDEKRREQNELLDLYRQAIGLLD